MIDVDADVSLHPLLRMKLCIARVVVFSWSMGDLSERLQYLTHPGLARLGALKVLSLSAR